MIRLIGFFSIIIWVLFFMALAIMFDWFGSRDIAHAALKGGAELVEYLEETGDSAQSIFDSASETAEEVKIEVRDATD